MAYRPKPGQLALNTTVKSASGWERTFAPTWQMVMDSKEGRISLDSYRDQYYHLMRLRWQTHTSDFLRIFEYTNVVLKCYCADTSTTTRHCHRYLLTDILATLGNAKGLAYELAGEVR